MPESTVSGIHRLARFLSLLGLFSAAMAISLTHFQFPPMAFELTILFSAVSIFMALACTGLALLLVSILLVRKVDPMPTRTSIITMVTLALSGFWLASY